MADKPTIKFKVLKQSARVGGKFYGVVDNANTVPASIVMQQVIDYKKLHNYNDKQLTALVEDVLQGVAELVARDGLSRNLSSLLKFEPRIKGTFGNGEATVTSQEVRVAPRMLKDIRVDIDKADFSFSNTNDSTAPKILSAALDYDGFDGWSAEGIFESPETGQVAFKGPLSLAGDRLCPNGWTADCKLTAGVYRRGELIGYIHGATDGSGNPCGLLSQGAPTISASNSIVVGQRIVIEENQCWLDDPIQGIVSITWHPMADDEIRFEFKRTLTDGSGTEVEATKTVTLTA